MRIALIDPFFDHSHKRWALGLQKHSHHKIDIYPGSAHHWKWKMTGGTIPIAQKVNNSKIDYDIFLVTDMLNVPLFKSLLKPDYLQKPFLLYFHENQISYPWSTNDQDVEEKRDHHYGFINFCSALISSQVFFNSHYHMDSFLNALPAFMKRFPKSAFEKDIQSIRSKSSVLPLGLDLPKYSNLKTGIPTFIWNHRWEYDKNPELFFTTLFRLKDNGINFQLIVVGKSFKRKPLIFEEARQKLESEIIHFGFSENDESYRELVSKANIILVTGHQDYFGISIVEAIAAGCYPILPNRLAYKEHVKRELHADVFYNSDAELYGHLVNVIQSKAFLNNKETGDFVRKYDWKNLIDLYDEVLI